MKSGFTLVELLAVIVILAVLALIATPVVLSIIDDAKESAMLRSAEMYLSGVENAVMRENMNSGGNFRPNDCTISNGNMTCGSTTVEVEVDGEVPSTGSIVFENGKIKEVTLNYESGTIVKDNSGNLIYEGSESELAPGLYDENNIMIYSWEELIEEDILQMTTDGINDTLYLSYGTNKDLLVGKLIIKNNIPLYYSGTFSGTPLTEVIFPDSITSIPPGCFAGSTNLKDVTIPSTIMSLSTGAFHNCTSLTIINYEGTIDNWNAITFENNWNFGCNQITVHCTDGDIIIPATN